MLSQKDKKWVRETVLSIIEEYSHAEAKRYIEEQEKKRKDRIEELQNAIEVLGANSAERGKLETQLSKIVLGATGVSSAALAKFMEAQSPEPDDAGATPKRRSNEYL